MGMSLQDRGTSTYDLPTLAPHVARCTHRRQTPLRWWQIRPLRQRTLSRSPSGSEPVPQSSHVRLWSQTSERIVKEHTAQGFHKGLVQRGKEATQGGTMREPTASEQGHKRGCKWLQALVIRFEGRFSTDGIAHQHDDKVDDFKPAEALAGEVNTLGDVGKQAQTAHRVGDQSYFAKPCRHRSNWQGFGLNTHRGRIVRTHTFSSHVESRSPSLG